MIAVMGASGNTGRVVAETLLARGEKVRAIARHVDRLAPLARAGAEVAAGDAGDVSFLTRAFTGAEAAYTLIPPDLKASPFRAYQDRLGEATARALAHVDPARLIGDALMDQRIVAGVGNVYRSETLFLCGISPWRAVGAVTAGEAARLGRTASRLLADGVRHPGPITTYRPPDPRSRERTWVYGRAGRPCRRCGTPVVSRGMGDANRTVSWCPTCQR